MSDPWSEWVDRHPVVVLEGGDGAGKTTAAAHLVDGHRYRRVHSGITSPDVDLFGRHHELITRPGRVVLDRSFVSEAVYGPMFRSGSRLSVVELRRLADTLADRSGLIVHVTASVDVIVARLAARGERSHGPSILSEVRERYDAVLATLVRHVRVERYDTSG